MDKLKVSIKMKMKLNISVVIHSYKLDNHERKYTILFQKMPIILCKEDLVTRKFC